MRRIVAASDVAIPADTRADVADGSPDRCLGRPACCCPSLPKGCFADGMARMFGGSQGLQLFIGPSGLTGNRRAVGGL